MDYEELKMRVLNLGTWKKNGKRAPNKPLLILFALGKLLNENTRYISYIENKKELGSLISEFTKSKNAHPDYPFLYLKNDGIWQLNNSIDTENYRSKDLADLSGGFNDQVYSILNNNPKLIQELVLLILEEYFPDTQYQEILSHIGFNFDVVIKRRRDPKFREVVLQAYEYRCAVCGFKMQLDQHFIGLEAAHIKWHMAGGPDIEENGLALCYLHHKLFDKGTFTLGKNNILIVSAAVHGSEGHKDWLLDYHGKELNTPVNPSYKPKRTYIDWHYEEVFRKPSRFLS